MTHFNPRFNHRFAIQVVPSVTGHDRWLLIRKGGIWKAWDAPRWLSFVSKRCGF